MSLSPNGRLLSKREDVEKMVQPEEPRERRGSDFRQVPMLLFDSYLAQTRVAGMWVYQIRLLALIGRDIYNRGPGLVVQAIQNALSG